MKYGRALQEGTSPWGIAGRELGTTLVMSPWGWGWCPHGGGGVVVVDMGRTPHPSAISSYGAGG